MNISKQVRNDVEQFLFESGTSEQEMFTKEELSNLIAAYGNSRIEGFRNSLIEKMEDTERFLQKGCGKDARFAYVTCYSVIKKIKEHPVVKTEIEPVLVH